MVTRVVRLSSHRYTQRVLYFYSKYLPLYNKDHFYHFEYRVFLSSVRWYSNERTPPNGGLIKSFIDNLRKNLEKSKEMQENLKAFESERSRIVKSDSVKLLREKIAGTQEWLITVSLKAIDTTRRSITNITKTSLKVFKQISRSDFGKKGQEVSTQMSKTAQQAAEKISEKAQVLGKTDVYKTISKGAETVKEDLFDDIVKESAPYQPPEQILKRTERATHYKSKGQPQPNIMQADDDTKDLTVTKQSKWKKQWSRLRENNPISNLFYGMKMRYDESDNLVIRATRSVTDKFGDTFGGVLTQSDMAETLAEIHKIDPNFNKEHFIKECQFEIIPTVLEAYLQGKVDILKDWCHEAAYNVLSAIIKQKTDNTKCKVLEVQNVDILGAKLLEQGPVMILTFNAQQLTSDITHAGNEILENVFYVWALCRDQSIYDPRMAWRVLEFGIQASGRLLV